MIIMNNIERLIVFAQAWARPTSNPRGHIRGKIFTYDFEAKPFEQWALGTNIYDDWFNKAE